MASDRCRHGVPTPLECPKCVEDAEHERDFPQEDPARGEREYEGWLDEIMNRGNW